MDASVAEPRVQGAVPRVQPAPLRGESVRAALKLTRTLGDEGMVHLDRATRRARVVARLDGYLTGPSREDAARIVLDFVRGHPDLYGLSEADLASLHVTRRYVSRGRVEHIEFEQRHGGIPIVESGLAANLTTGGRLINVLGAPAPRVSAPSLTPRLSARQARASARKHVPGVLGRAREPGQALQNGERAQLVLHGAARPRLAWRLLLDTADGGMADVLVDAQSGSALRMREVGRSANAYVFDRYPGAALGGTQRLVELGGYVTAPGGPRLEGPYAHVFADQNDDDIAQPFEEITASSGTDYLFPYQPFQGVPGITCPPAPYYCSWNPSGPLSWLTNRRQVATQVFFLASQFHDHLAAQPIEFTARKGGFEGPSRAVINTADGASLQDGLPDRDHVNNANNYTPPTGSPKLTFYLDTDAGTDLGDDASIVYHEYTHGLSLRLLTYSDGWGALNGPQAGAIGEGTSDWYAMDFLSARGYAPDGPGDGDVSMGPEATRTEPLDCPVLSLSPKCPGSAGAGPGGFTYGDYGKIRGQPEIHFDGEIWAQTLWDLRRALIARDGLDAGIREAQLLITAGMELSPVEPTFLDMRNAILQADTAYLGGAAHDLLWQVFAARGMGFFAGAAGVTDTRPLESFASEPSALPSGNLSGTVTDDQGAPMQGVRVFVGGLDGYGSAGALSDAQGRWAIMGLPAGTYRKIAAEPPYGDDGDGHDGAEAHDVPVLANATTIRNLVARRDWASRWGGAEITSTGGQDTACEPADAIDQLLGNGWRAEAHVWAGNPGPKSLTITLPQTIDVASVEVDPAPSCNTGLSAGLGRYSLELSRDGQVYTKVGHGSFAPADAGRLNPIALTPGPRLAASKVRLTLLSSFDSSSPGDDGARWMSLAEIGVYGSPSASESTPPSSVPAPAPPPAPAPAPAPVVPSGDRAAPVLSRIRVPGRIAVRRQRARRPIVIRLRSNERATVLVSLLRRTATGRLVKIPGIYRATIVRGQNRITLPRNAWRLTPGSYRLQLQASDRAGNRATWRASIRTTRTR